MRCTLKVWRATDGALKVTLTGLPCDRGHSGSATITIRGESTFAGWKRTATLPTRVTPRGAAVELGVQLKVNGPVCDTTLVEAAKGWLCAHVVGAWSDGACAIHGEASAQLWELDVREREARGLPVYRGAARDAQEAAA
jgi:hypothetical protein